MKEEDKPKEQFTNEKEELCYESLEWGGSERERISLKEALRRSEASLAEAQRMAHLGNWDWEIATNKLYWTDEIYRIFGLAPQEFGASYEAFLDSVHPDDRDLVTRSVDQALHENKPYSIDHRIVRPNRSERVVHEEAEVIRDESGRPIRMIVACPNWRDGRWAI